MKRSFVRMLPVLAVAAAFAGVAIAADWGKSTLLGTMKLAEEKVKDKGELKLERVNAVGLKEDGTIDLATPGSTLQYAFKAGGKSWSVSFTPIGQPEPYCQITESPVPGEELPGDVAKKLKDGADFAKAAKAAGVSFPANISIYTAQPGKAWAVISDNAGKNVILDPTTAEKTGP